MRGGHGEREMGGSRGALRGGQLGLRRESGDDRSKPNTTCSVEITPLPKNKSNYTQIRDLLHGIFIPRDSIKFLSDEQGNRTGVAIVKFSFPRDAVSATKRSGEIVMGQRVDVKLIDDEFYDSQVDAINKSFYDGQVDTINKPFYDSKVDTINKPFYNNKIDTINKPFYDSNVDTINNQVDTNKPLNDSQVDTRNKPAGGANYNAPELEEQALNKPAGGANYNAPDLEEQAINKPTDGANYNAPELEEQVPPTEPVPEPEPEPSPCLYVSGLPLGCGEHDVAEVFNNYIILDIVLDLVRGRRVPNGGCFIRLTSPEESQKAYNDLMGKATMDMKPLTIKSCPLPDMEQAVLERDAVLKNTRIPPFRPLEGKPGEIVLKNTRTPPLKPSEGKPGDIVQKNTQTPPLKPQEGKPGEIVLKNTRTPPLKPSEGKPGEIVLKNTRTPPIKPPEGKPGEIVLKNTRTPPIKPPEGKSGELKPSDCKESVKNTPEINNSPKDPKLGNQNNKPEGIKQVTEKSKSQDIKPKDSAQNVPIDNQNSKKPEAGKPEKVMPFGGDLLTDSVVIKGMPRQTSEANIRDFFSDEGLVPERIHICSIADGVKDAYIMFPQIKDTKLAVAKSNQQICKKKVIVELIPKPTVMKAMKLPFNPLELMKKGQEMANESQVPKEKPNEKLLNAIEKPTKIIVPDEDQVKGLPQNTEPLVPKPVEDKLETVIKHPNPPVETVNKRLNTPLETVNKSPNVSLATGNKRANTPLETGNKRPITPLETGNKRPITPLETGNKRPITPLETGNKRPITPLETGNKRPNTPLETGNKRPNTPLETGNKRPITPLDTVNKRPNTPLETGNKHPNTPLETGNKRPNTPVETGNKRPNTPIGELEARAYNQGPASVRPLQPSGPRMEARPLMEMGRGGPRAFRPRGDSSGPQGPRGIDSPNQREASYNRYDSPHQREKTAFPQENLDPEEPLGTPMPPENFGRPGCVVGVGNVPFRATTEDIMEFFRSVRLLRPENVIRRYNEYNRPTSDARVSLSSPEEAIQAIRLLRGQNIFNRSISLFIVQDN